MASFWLKRLCAVAPAAGRGGEQLSEPARAAVEASVAAWNGAPLPMAGSWLHEPVAGLPEADRPAARLALLAALAPYRITDADVMAWRTACGWHRDRSG